MNEERKREHIGSIIASFKDLDILERYVFPLTSTLPSQHDAERLAHDVVLKMPQGNILRIERVVSVDGDVRYSLLKDGYYEDDEQGNIRPDLILKGASFGNKQLAIKQCHKVGSDR